MQQCYLSCVVFIYPQNMRPLWILIVQISNVTLPLLHYISDLEV